MLALSALVAHDVPGRGKHGKHDVAGVVTIRAQRLLRLARMRFISGLGRFRQLLVISVTRPPTALSTPTGGHGKRCAPWVPGLHGTREEGSDPATFAGPCTRRQAPLLARLA